MKSLETSHVPHICVAALVVLTLGTSFYIVGCSQPTGDKTEEVPMLADRDDTGSSGVPVGENPTVNTPTQTQIDISDNQGASSEESVPESRNSEQPDTDQNVQNQPNQSGIQGSSTISSDMVPAVAEVPEGRSMDEIAQAVIRHVGSQFPDARVTSVDIIGSYETGSDNRSVGAGALICSYLITMEDGAKHGIEVLCSPSQPPYVTEPRFLSVSESEDYDPETGKYLSKAEAQAKLRQAATANADPEDPSHGYNESNPAPHTSVLVSDDHGHQVWVTQSDLG